MLFLLFQIILLIFQFIFFIFVGYLFVLTTLAWFAPKETPDLTAGKQAHFAILIPAHNEEVLLPSLLESLERLEYPTSCFDVHVIADNCTDHTATVAAAHRAIVHTRFNDTLIGKGYALDWGLKEIQGSGLSYDAFIIIDADTTVSTNFLQVMNRQLVSGANVVQAYYAVRDPEISSNVSLRYMALAVLHFLRPQGRSILGGSAGLKGNGMLFKQEILARYPWPASVTEDIEYHMVLLLAGYTVKFAPDATVWGEMPARFEQSQTQIDRWEYGRLDMARRFVIVLIKAAVTNLGEMNFRRAYVYFDAVMEHLIPPFSFLFGGSLLLVAADIVLLSTAALLAVPRTDLSLAWVNMCIGLFLLLGQGFYLFSGLQMVHAPLAIYKQLAFAPLFVFRKIGRYFKMLSGNKPQSWVKTTRNQP
jgi:1,2-diacylglycerol 3-beta-glucosyltransferase